MYRFARAPRRRRGRWSRSDTRLVKFAAAPCAGLARQADRSGLADDLDPHRQLRHPRAAVVAGLHQQPPRSWADPTPAATMGHVVLPTGWRRSTCASRTVHADPRRAPALVRGLEHVGDSGTSSDRDDGVPPEPTLDARATYGTRSSGCERAAAAAAAPGRAVDRGRRAAPLPDSRAPGPWLVAVPRALRSANSWSCGRSAELASRAPAGRDPLPHQGRLERRTHAGDVHRRRGPRSSSASARLRASTAACLVDLVGVLGEIGHDDRPCRRAPRRSRRLMRSELLGARPS